jgi:hypothetical protein
MERGAKSYAAIVVEAEVDRARYRPFPFLNIRKPRSELHAGYELRDHITSCMYVPSIS